MADENMNEAPSSAPASPDDSKMNPMVIVGIAVIVVAVVAGLFFLMGNKNQTGDESVTPVEEVTREGATGESTSGVMTQDGDVVSVTLEAGSFYFKPNVINAKLGQTVKVTINSVSQQHDFVIEELDVQSPMLPSGQNATVEFVASEVGTFEFYCSIGNHRQQGMVGTLNVTN